MRGRRGVLVADRPECRDQLAALPIADGDDLYVDGNSQGCRNLHAFLAVQTPEQHCPHISLSPLEDPDGKIKCQETSRQNLQVSDLFADAEMKAFRDYTSSIGLDPDTAVRECFDETSGCFF